MRMIRCFLSLPLVLAAGMMGVGAGPAAAEESTAGSVRKIGVVDLNRVFKEYGGTQATESQLEKLAREKQAEGKKMADEIQRMWDELALMNEEGRGKQREAIDQKRKGLAEFDQQTREQLRGEREQAIDKLLKEIEGIVTSYAKQNEYDLILTDRAALYFVGGIDVTNEILKILNGPAKKSP